MKKMERLVINDLHLGVSRVSGTTPATAMRLRQALLDNCRRMFELGRDKHIIVNGDLFDAFDIPISDALGFYHVVAEWMLVKKPEAMLILGQGNHDISKDSSRMSVFSFIGALLHSQYPDSVMVVTQPEMIFPNHYMIPHCLTQERFDIEMARVLEFDKPHYVYLHANYDNNFALEQDHSLNVSIEIAKALTDRGHILIFGHEHQQREPYEGVVIVGNQWPTSVSDCLANNEKRCLVIEDGPAVNHHVAEIDTWHAQGSFVQVDWRSLEPSVVVGGDFVRVTGSASAEEAAVVLQTISKLRQKSDAFVIANAVKIEGIQDMGDIAVSAEEMRAFDVLSFLYEHLDEDQAEVVKKLVSDSEAGRD